MATLKKSIKFYPEKRKFSGVIRTENVPLIMSVTWGAQRIMIPAGKRVDMKHWDQENQYAKDSQTEAKEINDRISELTGRVDDFFIIAGIEGRSVDDIGRQDLMDVIQGHKKIGKRYKVLELYAEFLKEQEALVKANKRPLNTFKKYRTVFNHLSDFINSQKKQKDIFFTDVDFDFLDLFADFMLYPPENSAKYKKYEERHGSGSAKDSEIGMTNNTVAKDIKILKSFLNWGLDEGKHKSDKFKDYSYSEDDPEIVSLTWDELSRLYNAEMPFPYLDRARDVWVFMAVTALSYIDVKKLTKSQIHPDGYIRMIRKKTQRLTYTIKDKKRKDRMPKQVNIPLTFISKEIIEKYSDIDHADGLLLPVPSNQKLNDYIKEACKIAGIDQETTLIRGRGKESVVIGPAPKYEFVSTKVARKTFASIAFILGMPRELVQKVTGHSTAEVLEKHYLNIFPAHLQKEMERVFETLRRTAQQAGGNFLRKVD